MDVDVYSDMLPFDPIAYAAVANDVKMNAAPLPEVFSLYTTSYHVAGYYDEFAAPERRELAREFAKMMTLPNEHRLTNHVQRMRELAQEIANCVSKPHVMYSCPFTKRNIKGRDNAEKRRVANAAYRLYVEMVPRLRECIPLLAGKKIGVYERVTRCGGDGDETACINPAEELVDLFARWNAMPGIESQPGRGNHRWETVRYDQVEEAAQKYPEVAAMFARETQRHYDPQERMWKNDERAIRRGNKIRGKTERRVRAQYVAKEQRMRREMEAEIERRVYEESFVKLQSDEQQQQQTFVYCRTAGAPDVTVYGPYDAQNVEFHVYWAQRLAYRWLTPVNTAPELDEEERYVIEYCAYSTYTAYFPLFSLRRQELAAAFTPPMVVVQAATSVEPVQQVAAVDTVKQVTIVDTVQPDVDTNVLLDQIDTLLVVDEGIEQQQPAAAVVPPTEEDILDLEDDNYDL